MSIIEIRSQITYRSLMNKSKDQLATLAMELLRELHRVREKDDQLKSELEAAEALIRGLKSLHREHVGGAA